MRGSWWRASPPWLLGLLLLTAWIYWPGLSGPVLLDDAANLERVQALASSEGFAIDVLTDNTSGPLGRPVSMASFMLDLYLLDGGVWGAKLTNLLVHLTTGMLVWLFSRQLLTALGSTHNREYALWIAALWLMAPLLVSTTLYMVQRMAQLSALFSLASLCAYLQWRSRGHAPLRSLWWPLCLLLAALAVLSKENGLLTIPLLVLVELAVLQPRDRDRGAPVPVRMLGMLHLVILGAGVLLVLVYLFLSSERLVASYWHRDFTLWERLLTQPRILWHYAGQLLWADSASLGLFHDGYPFSTGITTPGTTLPAMVGLLLTGLAALAGLRYRAWRGLGFGWLFFLLGHSLEGSVFALELYFEHRNYLPAVGLFIALLSAFDTLAKRFPSCRPWSGLVLAVMVLHAGMVTARESQIWSNGRVFHLVAESRFPNSVRAKEGLAMEFATLGDADLALDYVAMAQTLDPQGGFRHSLTEALVYCRAEGAIPSERFLSWEMSPEDFRDRLVNETSYTLARNLIEGRCEGTDKEALADHWGQMVLAMEVTRVTPKIFLSLAILENHLQRYEQALYYVNRLLQRSPEDLRAHMMRLYFAGLLNRSADYEDSLARLVRAREQGRLSAQESYNLELLSTGGSQ